MTTTPALTADQLTAGTVVRFQPRMFGNLKLTVRIDRDASVAPASDTDRYYAVFHGYRVRPADTSASFGLRKVYCVNVDRIEIVQGA